MKNVCVAGSRNLFKFVSKQDAINQLIEKLDELGLEHAHQFAIVNGMAAGGDEVGGILCALNPDIAHIQMPAKWDDLEAEPCVIKTGRYGRQYNALAGYNRNAKMREIAHILIAFWDGKSRGTKEMIDECRKAGIEVHVINY